MSLRLSAAQFDSSFRPSSLCNWEVPRDPSPITRAASPGPTKFVVGDNATTYLPSSTVYLKDGSGSFTYN